jgi:hypothetical protein
MITQAEPERRRHVRGAAGLLLLPAWACGLFALDAASAGASTRQATSQSIQGTVTTIEKGERRFVVKTTTGSTVIVQVSAATLYRDSFVRTPSFADLRAGVSVAVIGTTAKGVEDAAIVIIGGSGHLGEPGPGFFGPGGTRPGVFGKVVTINAKDDRFSVKEPNGTTVTVEVTGSTRVREPGKAKADLSDLRVGDEVAVTGTKHGSREVASEVLFGFRSFSAPGPTSTA